MKMIYYFTIIIFPVIILSCNKDETPQEIKYIGYTKSDSVLFKLIKLNSQLYLKKYLPSSLNYPDDTIKFYSNKSGLYYQELEFKLDYYGAYQIFDSTRHQLITIEAGKTIPKVRVNNMEFNNCQEFTVKYSELNIKDAMDLVYIIDFNHNIILQTKAINTNNNTFIKYESIVDYK